MELFDKKFVHFMWDDELKGKRGFLSSGIGLLIKMVNEDSDRTEIQKGCERGLPFCKHITVECRFAYYDPNYEVKKAYYKEGKTVQVKKIDSFADWVDCHRPRWCKECLYRIKPDCPCEDGIDFKACAGCEHSEDDKPRINKNYAEGACKDCLERKRKRIEERASKFGEVCVRPEYDDEKCKKCNECIEGSDYRPFKNCDELIEFWQEHFPVAHNRICSKPFIWVRLKVDKRERLIVAFGTDFVEIGNKAKAVTLQRLFDDYEFLDGCVIGVKKE